MEGAPEQTSKIIMIGDNNVGKTAFVQKISGKAMGEESTINTIGIDFQPVQVKIKGVMRDYQLWDNAGQEKFLQIKKMYFKGAKGIILMFDETNAESYENVTKIWTKNI